MSMLKSAERDIIERLRKYENWKRRCSEDLLRLPRPERAEVFVTVLHDGRIQVKLEEKKHRYRSEIRKDLEKQHVLEVDTNKIIMLKRYE